jgi:hypothetical protein
MVGIKTAADALTSIRFLLGLYLIWLGLRGGPEYAAMIWTAWRTVPPYGLLLAAWIGFVLVATWPRFPQQTLPEFLGGMCDLLRQH